MNTRSRIALSTLLGLALTGVCLGSAQAQSGMNDKKMMHDNMSQSDMMDDDDMMMDPAPLSYPFAAPGSLHLYHWTDYTHKRIVEESTSMAKMDMMHHEDMKMHDKMMHDDEMMMRDGYMLTDEDGMTATDRMMMMDRKMIDPAPIGYPFAAPGSLHLYHWTDFSKKHLAEESASMAKMDNIQKRDRMMHDKMMHDDEMIMRDGYMLTDENGMTMMDGSALDPAPIGYPFAAPGSLHLYHWTDYSKKHLAEESASMKKMDDAHMEDKKRMERVNNRKNK